MAVVVTHVTVKLDQLALQTIKMGLSAMQLNAQTVDASLDNQVQEQLAAAELAANPPPADSPAPPKELNGGKANGNAHKPAPVG